MTLIVLFLLQTTSGKPLDEVVQAIKADALFAHVKEIASDDYKGREAGTPGAEKAAEYLEAKLKEWKIAPAGVRGMYSHPFTADGKATRNIIGVLPGSHPALKNEFVLIGAHYDHIGARGGGDDPINNGADDNASGTAVTLEIARAMAAASARPSRSILFAFWSAEEKGLVGSKFFTDNPTVNLRTIVACLNLDMVGRNAEDQIDIEGTGCSPDLRALFDRVNGRKLFAKINYEVKQVKQDTDHYWFYASGIPAVEFFSGYHADYHKPGDESEKVSAAKLERVGKFVAISAWEVATAKTRPAFKKVK